MNISPLHLLDGYKTDHKRQYPENTVKIYSNFTPRKSRVKTADSVIVFGFNLFLKDLLINEWNKNFFQKSKADVIGRFRRRLNNYLPDNEIKYDHIEALHDLGYLPILIKALPEGSLVKCGVPIFTITNTIGEFFWLPNFLETILSCEIWGMCTSATTIFNYRLIFDKYALATTGSTDFSSKFQIHDFSMRGQMGRYAAMMNGAAHLIGSRGTDTVPSIDLLEDYYNANSDTELIGTSVPATEHSVMCMGMKEGERATFKRLIVEVYSKGIVAIVSDTWDFFGVVKPKTGIAAALKKEIMARNGKVTLRPDSGNPTLIICGYTIDEIVRIDGIAYKFEDVEYYNEKWNNPDNRKSLSEEEVKGAIECLWDEFGGTVTEQGYKLLDSHIGLIYGDSITLERAEEINKRLMDKGFASTNWVAGVGSYSYQYVTRDTYGFAMKATYGELAHELTDEEERELFDLGLDKEEVKSAYTVEPREIFKDPITDHDPITGISVKKSAKGLLVVYKDENGDFYMEDQVTVEEEQDGELIPIFEDGELLVDAKLSDIRALVDQNVLRKLAV